MIVKLNAFMEGRMHSPNTVPALPLTTVDVDAQHLVHAILLGCNPRMKQPMNKQALDCDMLNSLPVSFSMMMPSPERGGGQQIPVAVTGSRLSKATCLKHSSQMSAKQGEGIKSHRYRW